MFETEDGVHDGVGDARRRAARLPGGGERAEGHAEEAVGLDAEARARVSPGRRREGGGDRVDGCVGEGVELAWAAKLERVLRRLGHGGEREVGVGEDARVECAHGAMRHRADRAGRGEARVARKLELHRVRVLFKEALCVPMYLIKYRHAATCKCTHCKLG